MATREFALRKFYAFVYINNFRAIKDPRKCKYRVKRVDRLPNLQIVDCQSEWVLFLVYGFVVQRAYQLLANVIQHLLFILAFEMIRKSYAFVILFIVEIFSETVWILHATETNKTNNNNNKKIGYILGKFYRYLTINSVLNDSNWLSVDLVGNKLLQGSNVRTNKT